MITEMPTSPPPDQAIRIPEASFLPANHWAVDSGREYVVIEDLQALDPFFLSMVSAGEQWLFCSSDGALTAGRKSPDSALFPYYTVDKIIDNWNSTGPWTALVCDGCFWNPFRPLIASLSPVRRRLLKSVLGDELIFDELHEELGLRLTYRWQFSARYGFVRRATLTNEGSQDRTMRVADGLDNFLPAGVDNRMQLQYSCLADAYKVSELHGGGNLVVHRIASGITDAPIPLESLRATTVWTRGLGEGPTYMVRKDAEAFLGGQAPPAAKSIRARRGAMFLARELSLAPGESIDWVMVADIEQTQAEVAELRQSLSDAASLEAAVEEDVARGRQRLRELVASADGFQQTADRDTALYHYQNTLCNIMRGGVPEKGSAFQREQFLRYLDLQNRPVKEAHAAWLKALPESLERGELMARIEALGEPDLLRLAEEYLPLILSRRHGDPSRPWNRFVIRLQDESGEAVHHFEGNWRDIFQNWEALAWSYPEFLGGFISKFLNASTVDGFNPYRITSEGVDWEVPDEEDPWVSIGYWGDHQIVYLLKLLELEAKLHPEQLAARLDTPIHVFADVPYRLKSWEETLADPRNTVEFDPERHARLLARKELIGADGLLLRGENGETVRVTLAEKLLLPAVVKLANLVPGGGIWLNTQKPEWNDANNALAGCGLSVVTACHLYRYLGFVETMIGGFSGSTLLLTPALARLMETMRELLADARWQHQATLSGADRFALVELAGRALERHRDEVYATGPGLPAPFERATILAFLQNARSALAGMLRQNRRADGLWHSYNVLAIGSEERTMEVERLPVMLEGQVAILSAELLEPAEALDLLEALPGSALRSERHQTYLLYPDREVTTFLESNRVAEEMVRPIPTLGEMVVRGDSRLLVTDPEGGFRFHSSLTNGYALTAVLDDLRGDPKLTAAIDRDRPAIEALYESVFQHRSFTGRSGSMFGYEGLGSVYWHMVSKLMLAAQEVTLRAAEGGAAVELVQGLTAAYFSIQSGLGYRKSPQSYGAFPAEPYSHSPAHAGAQQPGLTGQVKEGILCRFGELGVDFQGARLRFHPRLLRDTEFAGLPAGPEHPALPSGTISFTLAHTPVSYHRRNDIEEACAVVQFSDGSETVMPAAWLDRETTSEITRQTGVVTRIDVDIPSHWLIS